MRVGMPKKEQKVRPNNSQSDNFAVPCCSSDCIITSFTNQFMGWSREGIQLRIVSVYSPLSQSQRRIVLADQSRSLRLIAVAASAGLGGYLDELIFLELTSAREHRNFGLPHRVVQTASATKRDSNSSTFGRSLSVSSHEGPSGRLDGFIKEPAGRHRSCGYSGKVKPLFSSEKEQTFPVLGHEKVCRV